MHTRYTTNDVLQRCYTVFIERLVDIGFHEGLYFVFGPLYSTFAQFVLLRIHEVIVLSENNDYRNCSSRAVRIETDGSNYKMAHFFHAQLGRSLRPQSLGHDHQHRVLRYTTYGNLCSGHMFLKAKSRWYRPDWV